MGSIRFAGPRTTDSEVLYARPHAMSAYSQKFHGAYLSCASFPSYNASFIIAYPHERHFSLYGCTYTLMMSHSPELHVKILMIGNSSVGKSSLLMRWSENQWLPEDEAGATIGVEVKVGALLTPIETFTISDRTF